MQNKWFGDDKDIVKWAGLIRIAQANKAKTIIQIPYLMQGEESGFKLHVEGVNKSKIRKTIPKILLEQFHDIRTISKMFDSNNYPKINVFFCKTTGEEAPQTREDYMNCAQKTVCGIKDTPRIVFLDPDTGIEPPSGAKEKHVTYKEIACWYDLLSPKDTLVIYQHRSRSGNGNQNNDQNIANNNWIQNKINEINAKIEKLRNVEKTKELASLLEKMMQRLTTISKLLPEEPDKASEMALFAFKRGRGKSEGCDELAQKA